MKKIPMTIETKSLKGKVSALDKYLTNRFKQDILHIKDKIVVWLKRRPEAKELLKDLAQFDVTPNQVTVAASLSAMQVGDEEILESLFITDKVEQLKCQGRTDLGDGQYKHTHVAEWDDNGNGETKSTDGAGENHKHEIRGLSVMRGGSDEHKHLAITANTTSVDLAAMVIGDTISCFC